jgi:hypothetical protein
MNNKGQEAKKDVLTPKALCGQRLAFCVLGMFLQIANACGFF